jgi:hypothetical protein
MAYEFNGSSQRLTPASVPVTAAPLTMACFFRAANITHRGALITLTANANNTNYFLLYAEGTVSGDPVRVLDRGGGSEVTASTTSGFTANTWHHACGVRSSSSNRTVYLDGGNSATNSGSATPAGLDQFNIGSFKAVAGNFFNGQMAEVGIWNAALTAEEVASLAKGMTCDKVRPQSLVFYAPLVRDLQDVRGGLTITNNNTATVAVHPRVYA